MPAYVQMRSTKPFAEMPSIFSIGGFELLIGAQEIGFDFNFTASQCTTDEDGYLFVNVRLKCLDTETFPESEQLTNDILKHASLTEINYECFVDEEEKVFIPMVCTHFQFDMDFSDTSLRWTFTEDQLKPVNDELKVLDVVV